MQNPQNTCRKSTAKYTKRGAPSDHPYRPSQRPGTGSIYSLERDPSTSITANQAKRSRLTKGRLQSTTPIDPHNDLGRGRIIASKGTPPEPSRLTKGSAPSDHPYRPSQRPGTGSIYSLERDPRRGPKHSKAVIS